MAMHCWCSPVRHSGTHARSHALVTAVLNARPLVWLGKISYSVYMVHTALLLVTGALLDKVFHVPRALGARTAPVRNWSR